MTTETKKQRKPAPLSKKARETRATVQAMVASPELRDKLPDAPGVYVGMALTTGRWPKLALEIFQSCKAFDARLLPSDMLSRYATDSTGHSVLDGAFAEFCERLFRADDGLAYTRDKATLYGDASLDFVFVMRWLFDQSDLEWKIVPSIYGLEKLVVSSSKEPAKEWMFARLAHRSEAATEPIVQPTSPAPKPKKRQRGYVAAVTVTPTEKKSGRVVVATRKTKNVSSVRRISTGHYRVFINKKIKASEQLVVCMPEMGHDVMGFASVLTIGRRSPQAVVDVRVRTLHPLNDTYYQSDAAFRVEVYRIAPTKARVESACAEATTIDDGASGASDTPFESET
ncbi:MAG: hypothetical protein ACHREM_01135 [Polyangiales bacterium]